MTAGPDLDEHPGDEPQGNLGPTIEEILEELSHPERPWPGDWRIP